MANNTLPTTMAKEISDYSDVRVKFQHHNTRDTEERDVEERAPNPIRR